MGFRSRLMNGNRVEDLHEMKTARSLIHFDGRSFGFGLLVGFIVVTFIYSSMSKNVDMIVTKPTYIAHHASPSVEKFIEQRTDHGRYVTHDENSKKNGIGSPVSIPHKITEKSEGTKLTVEQKPLCDFSHHRSAICDIQGDIRIIGKTLSTVLVVTDDHTDRNESYKVRPYARKWDKPSLLHVREVNVKSLKSFGEKPPQCTLTHPVPAVLFAISGYAGNYFHDFTDLLVPLFQTARQFNGEVRLVITNNSPFWIRKYLPFFQKLSNYEVIDYDKDDRVHCFSHVIVGLRSDRDLTIEPANSPRGYSMVDFMKFMRATYNLSRETAVSISEGSSERPKLLIISRTGSRKFTNLGEIVDSATKIGYEVEVSEASYFIANFSHVVNSCDVLMGVHGAGLTNFVFLPMNAVVIQVVPFGNLEWIANTYFGGPIRKISELRYLEYKISEEESSLMEIYSRDDPVFRDPLSIQKLGWNKMGEIYLDKQNVKLDMDRFKPVLIQALRLLSKKK